LSALHPDLDSAVVETLAAAVDQSEEFKRRLRKLIENATTSNLADNDVREVIELAKVDDGLED
jgi:CRISPR/Cas system-associated endonuclease Cas3-HD